MSQVVKKSLIALSVGLFVFSIFYACNCTRPKKKQTMIISGLTSDVICHAAPRLGMNDTSDVSQKSDHHTPVQKIVAESTASNRSQSPIHFGAYKLVHSIVADGPIIITI